MTQTAALAAFIGGFAFKSLSTLPHTATIVDQLRYIFTVFAVHACVCSALTSAILYWVLHALHDDEVERWSTITVNKWLLRLPMMKFTMGWDQPFSLA